jgi:ferredoxin, 2Fe-2S
MPKISYIQNDGAAHHVDVDAGVTLMEGSVQNNLPGIIAECGGSCSCATCHIYVDGVWLDRLGEPAPEESELLEYLDGSRANSRLACQIVVTEGLDGLVVEVPMGS